MLLSVTETGVVAVAWQVSEHLQIAGRNNEAGSKVIVMTGLRRVHGHVRQQQSDESLIIVCCCDTRLLLKYPCTHVTGTYK